MGVFGFTGPPLTWGNSTPSVPVTQPGQASVQSAAMGDQRTPIDAALPSDPGRSISPATVTLPPRRRPAVVDDHRQKKNPRHHDKRSHPGCSPGPDVASERDGDVYESIRSCPVSFIKRHDDRRCPPRCPNFGSGDPARCSRDHRRDGDAQTERHYGCGIRPRPQGASSWRTCCSPAPDPLVRPALVRVCRPASQSSGQAARAEEPARSTRRRHEQCERCGGWHGEDDHRQHSSHAGHGCGFAVLPWRFPCHPR